MCLLFLSAVDVGGERRVVVLRCRVCRGICGRLHGGGCRGCTGLRGGAGHPRPAAWGTFQPSQARSCSRPLVRSLRCPGRRCLTVCPPPCPRRRWEKKGVGAVRPHGQSGAQGGGCSLLRDVANGEAPAEVPRETTITTKAFFPHFHHVPLRLTCSSCPACTLVLCHVCALVDVSSWSFGFLLHSNPLYLVVCSEAHISVSAVVARGARPTETFFPQPVTKLSILPRHVVVEDC